MHLALLHTTYDALDRYDELRSAALFVKILGSYPAKALRAPARPGLAKGQI